MFCNNCGQQISDNATFCPNCGTATVPQPQQAPVQYQQNQYQQDQQDQYQQNQYQYQQGQPGQQKGAFDQVMDTPDYTNSFDPMEIQNGKGMSVLAYLGILVLIPLLAEKNNRFVRFHVNQGLVLCIAGIIVSVAGSILSYIPVIGGIARLLLSLAVFVLFIIGLVNVFQGKAKELPLIGGIKLVS